MVGETWLCTRARNLLPVAELLVFGALGPCIRWLVLLFAGSVKMLVLQDDALDVVQNSLMIFWPFRVRELRRLLERLDDLHVPGALLVVLDTTLARRVGLDVGAIGEERHGPDADDLLEEHLLAFVDLPVHLVFRRRHLFHLLLLISTWRLNPFGRSCSSLLPLRARDELQDAG